MSKKFILIGHRKRQGKDTFAKMLKEQLGDAEIMAFADPMKEILAEVYGISVEQIDLFKNEHEGWRDMIKRFGNGKMVEIFGEQVWRDVLIKRAEKSNAKYIIVPDFRFMRENIDGAFTVNVIRNNDKSDQHQSEAELDTYLYDVTVFNEGALENLYLSAVSLANYIRPKDTEVHYTANAFQKYNDWVDSLTIKTEEEEKIDSREEEMKKVFPVNEIDKVNEALRGFQNMFKNAKTHEEDADYQNLLKDDEHEENIEKVYGGELKEISLGKGTLTIGDKEPVFGEIFCRFR